MLMCRRFRFFFQAEDGIRDVAVTGVQTCALPISNALSGEPTNGAWLDDRLRRLFEAVAVPLRASANAAPQGVLIAAYAVDDSLAQDQAGDHDGRCVLRTRQPRPALHRRQHPAARGG